MASGLAAAMMGPAAGDEADSGDEASAELTSFSEYADDVYDALKADNRTKFASALKKAIHACYDEE
jgi:hypothetical protein